MKRRRLTPEQIVRKLRGWADRLLGEGMALPEVTNQLEVSEATHQRWRGAARRDAADDVKRLKEPTETMPDQLNWSVTRLEKEYCRSRAVIGRYCSILSRRPPAGKTCLSLTSRAVSSEATETPFTSRTRLDLRGSW